MKTLLTALAATLLITSFAATADAAKRRDMSRQEAICKRQAEKKISAVHFLQRRNYVKRCMGEKA
jgi:hypothetical protein